MKPKQKQNQENSIKTNIRSDGYNVKGLYFVVQQKVAIFFETKHELIWFIYNLAEMFLENIYK